MPPIRPGEGPDELLVFDHGFVRLDDCMASDLSVVNSARVSFAVRKEEMDERDSGLIKFLMRDRHGCYDGKTEVLTGEGWKAWPKVTGEESFATVSPAGMMRFQRARRVVHREHRGHMLGLAAPGLDLLVTPDHRIVAGSARGGPFARTPACRLLWRPHRHLAAARWAGRKVESISIGGASVPARDFLRLVGLAISRGSISDEGDLRLGPAGDGEQARLASVLCQLLLECRPLPAGAVEVRLPPAWRRLLSSCGVGTCPAIPRELLAFGSGLAESLLEGLAGGGELPANVRIGAASSGLADAIQELALRAGRSAAVAPAGLGRWEVELGSGPARFPAVCTTPQDAGSQMGVESYNGTIHCVEVPDGTLCVRRNGVAVFSGNTPFEHNAFRFHIRCPIFVAREWFRHRVGSFNEESARYHQLKADFYVPDPEAVRSQVGKPGAYRFEPLDAGRAEEAVKVFAQSYAGQYSRYEELVEAGVAKELARAVLPVGIYTQFYWTLNARSLMNFLSLRNSDLAQYEIRMFAEAVEDLFKEKMPVTHQCFVEFGRIGP